MRKTLTTLTLFVTILGVAGVASGQRPVGGGGGGGGLLPLINNESVKKELGITEEQSKAAPAAVNAAIETALGKVLNEKQLARLKQIELQQKRENAYLDAKVQETLKMTDTQKDNVKSIIDEYRKERGELGGGGFGKGSQEKIEALRKGVQEKIDGVLSLDQRAAYRKLVGETFEIKFNFGDFGKKDAPKKTAE